MNLNDAVKMLVEADPAVILFCDPHQNVYVLPAILEEDKYDECEDDLCEGCEKCLAHPAGTVEYQISDGIEGDRSHSIDVYDFNEAAAIFEKIVINGWDFEKVIGLKEIVK